MIDPALRPPDAVETVPTNNQSRGQRFHNFVNMRLGASRERVRVVAWDASNNRWVAWCDPLRAGEVAEPDVGVV